jgi:hypothetical protein
MKKKIYTTPVVEISRWASEDIIRTSTAVSASTQSLSIITKNDGIAKVSYKELN